MGSQLDFEDDGLRLLSIDAGDIRALSQILILGEFMSRLEWLKKTLDALPPCRYFHMIIGVGLGGILAILFGVFGMTAEQASQEFVAIHQEVFIDGSLSRAERSKKLKQVIESLLERHNLPLDTRLLHNGTSSPSTRTIVCTTPLVNMEFCRPFRTFTSQHISDDPTIVEVIMATCSTLDLFEPVSIGVERIKEDFITGSYSAANPINELIKEAHEHFGPERTVSCIISIGAGGTPFTSLTRHQSTQEATLTIDVKLLESIIINSERTAEEIERRLGGLDVYFRFTVNRGLAPSSDNQLGFIEGCTKSYLQIEDVNKKLDQALKFFSEPGRVELDRLYRTRQTNLKPTSGLPPLSAFFVLRPKPMDMLSKSLLDEDTRRQRKVIVSGMSGCGKSQLVSYFARINGHNYEHIIFIDASSADSIRNTIIQRARAMGHGYHIKTIEDALNLLSQLDGDPWLIIFDNADSIGLELAQFFPDCDHGSIIVTTRNPSLGLLSPNSHITLDVMSRSEAVDVILNCAFKSAALSSDSDRKHAIEIVKELGYLPVAIVQAGCFIRLQDCMETYLDRYRKSRRSLLQRPAKAQLDKHHHSIYIALDITVPALSSRALQLSSLLGFFHYTGIPLPLFERVAQRSFKLQPFDLLNTPPHFHDTVSLLQEIISPDGEWDEEVFRSTLEELQNYSLVTLVNLGTIQTIRYHTLVRAWAQDRLMPFEIVKFKAAAVRMLACGMSNEDDDISEYLTVHIESLSSDWDELHVNDRAAFANVLRNDGDIDVALKMWFRIHTEVEAVHSEDHLSTSEASLQLAECYRATGKLEDALSLSQKVMEYRTSTLGSNNRETLRATACYGRLLPYKEAKPLQTLVFNKTKDAFGLNHPETAQAMEDLANTLSKKFVTLGDACKLMDEVVSIRTKFQGENHRATLRAKERLATINGRGRDKAEANRLLVEVVAGRRKVWGADHRETLRSMAQLARSYEQQSQHAQAFELWVEILNHRNKDTYEEYEECTHAIERIAERHVTDGNHAEAERLYQTLFEINKDTYGIEHEVTISTMEHICRLLEAQGKSSDANSFRESILNAQRQVFGGTSSRVLSTMEKMALSYEQHKNFEQAVQLRKELVRLRDDTLGPNAPKTRWAKVALQKVSDILDARLRYKDSIASWRSQMVALYSSEGIVQLSGLVNFVH